MKNLLILLSFCVYTNLYSQQYGTDPLPRPKNCDATNTCPRNTIFHETNFRFDRLGLNWNSINWDHTLVCRSTYLISFRLGIDYFSFSKIRSAGVPFELNLMLGGGALMLETGLGLNYLYVYKNYNDTIGRYKDDVSYLAMTGRLGLRFEKKHSIFFRAGYTPIYNLVGYKEIPIISDRKFISMFGAAVGWTF